MIDKTEEAVKTTRTSGTESTQKTVQVKAPTTIELQKNALPDAIKDESANKEFLTKLNNFFGAYV